MIRTAAIGYGDIATRRHFPQLLDLASRSSLVAIAGRNPAKLEACASAFNVPRWTTDVDQILSDDGIDAVLVLTPPESHRSLAKMCIEAGKHVMVEKPLVKTVEDVSILLGALERQQQKKPITFFPLPHVAIPEHLIVARLLADGIVGQVTSVECHRGHRGPTHASWFYNKELAGGGVLFDLGIYQLTTVAHLFGPAKTVSAICTTRFETRELDDGSIVNPDVEDSALVNLQLQDGTAVSVNANWNGYLSHHATRMRVVVIGREGILHFGVVDGGVYFHRPDGKYGFAAEGSEEVSFEGYPCRRILAGTPATRPPIVADFIKMIEVGDTSMRPLQIQRHVMEIVAESFRSSEQSRTISLTTTY